MLKLILSVLIPMMLLSSSYAGPIPDEFKEVAPEIRATCMKESGVDEAIIDKASNGEFTNDEKLKCYIKCIFDQFRLISSQGFNFQQMLNLAPPKIKDSASKVVVACKDLAWSPDHLCDLAFDVAKCMQATSPDDYFLM